jgi:hypothetical protein
MNSILFSANPKIVTMSDVISHLKNYDQVYFEVKFPIIKAQFSSTIIGFIHISGQNVKYAAEITDIVPFSTTHYEDSNSYKIKPEKWLIEWKNNVNNIRNDNWKHALVITKVIPFEYDTYAFKRTNGKNIKIPPLGYVKVLLPSIWAGF